MKKKYTTLNTKFKEILYAMSGLGPNLLMVLMGAYFTDAINPTALGEKSIFAISEVSFILPAVFPVVWMIAKMFDGIVDIPLASLTDNLKTKWGRRRPPIAICFIPMVLAYAMCWLPISQTNQLVNTIWITVWAFIFFTTYTMCLIAFYGSLSTVCINEKQRLTVSSFKAFFDTISYCLVYALIPLILQVTKIRIDKLVFMLLPIMLTMLIPLFMIKEGKKFEEKAIAEGYDITPLADEPTVKIKDSIVLTFKNKIFNKWLIVNCCTFFGLQMFLVSMNALITNGMGLSGGQMALLNTCAFAPVPIMLYLFNKLKVKKGLRFSYQTCLLSFAISILSFIIGSRFVLGPDKVTLQIIIGCLGSIIGSWSIGAFFMIPYMIPTQISAIEEKLTGRNHSAMYFAAQAIVTSIIGAIAGGLVYENVKMLFFSTSGGITWAEPEVISGEVIEAIQVAADKLGVGLDTIYNFGLVIIPIIVSLVCLAGFFLCYLMPKNYTPKSVAKELGLEDELSKHPELNEEPEPLIENESFIVNIALWILSGTLFGLIWRYGIMATINKLKPMKYFILHSILSIIIPFYFAFIIYKVNKKLLESLREKNIEVKDLSLTYCLLAIFFLNIVSYIIIQKHLNKLSDKYQQELQLEVEGI